jgi:molybdenum cofactor synthesis domain-containing protein
MVSMGSEADLPDRHFDVSGKGFKHLTSTRDAVKLVVSRLPGRVQEIEDVPISSALHRVLGEDLISLVDVPSFDRAAMDGYAVRAEDTYSASLNSPIALKLVGEANAGKAVVKKGEASMVVTGGQMPQGADAVVMSEYAKELADGTVEVSAEVHPMENVSCVGEDLRKGTLVLRKGQRLLPQDIGMLVYLGYDHVKVKRRLKIAVLSTGNEIHDGPITTPGKIPDVNRPTLLNAISEIGCEPIDLGIAVDEPDVISNRLKQAIASADIILVTAGTSVGPRDFVPQVIDSLGKPGMLVHGVAMRPSMPTGLGIVGGKAIVSLPGYPVSAYLAFLEFIPSLVDEMLETSHLPRPVVRAKVVRRVAGVLGSRTYVRVRVSEEGGNPYAAPVSVSGAGILSSLVRSNGFLIVPENVEGYEEGEMVEVELFRPVESGNANA